MGIRLGYTITPGFQFRNFFLFRSVGHLGFTGTSIWMDLEKDVSLPQEVFDVIVCFNYLHRPLIPQLKGALRLGGMMVYETYIVDQAQFGRPKNPKHLLKHNELLKLFHDFRCLRYREGILERRKAIAGFIGTKL